MSLQLPTILSPPTPCTPVLRSLCSPQSRSRSCRCPFPGRLPFWASPFPSRLANASGRIEFIIFLIIDWLFASGCSPPRLSATQLPSATDSQCFCPTGTSTPLLVRTLRRTRVTLLRDRVAIPQKPYHQNHDLNAWPRQGQSHTLFTRPARIRCGKELYPKH